MSKSKKTTRIRVTRTGRRLVVALCVTLGMTLMSCNVTRTITTSLEYFQKGDSTCTIVTKTIETYDATKKQ